MPNQLHLLSYITPEKIAAFTNDYEPPELELSSLFTISKSNNILVEARMMSEDGDRTPMASVHALNTSVKMAGRPNWETLKAEKLLIKEAIELNSIQATFLDNAGTDRDFFERNVFNDFRRRFDAVHLRRYALATEPLSTGFSTINENNVKTTINHLMPPENFLFTDWTKPDADIMGDLQRLFGRKYGRKIKRAITSTKVAFLILQNEGIKAAFKLLSGGYGYTTTIIGSAFEANLNAVTMRVLGLAIKLNDETFDMMNADGTVTEYRVYDENRITFLNGEMQGTVGHILAGVTEEERMGRPNVSESSNFISTYRWQEENPPRDFLQAATVALPIYPNIKTMFIAKVAGN